MKGGGSISGHFLSDTAKLGQVMDALRGLIGQEFQYLEGNNDALGNLCQLDNSDQVRGPCCVTVVVLRPASSELGTD